MTDQPVKFPAQTSQPSRRGGSLLLAGACCLLLASCASTPKLGGDTAVTVVAAKDLPAPTRADANSEQYPYLIGPFDRLVIDVFGIEDLSKREVQVDASGRISFPLVGEVSVSGKTPAEVEAALVGQLKRAYVRNPQVTVNLKETLSQTVTVEGVVQKPGLYPVVGHMTLLRAIATAQGTTEFSRLDDVVVFRTVGDKRYAALYDLKALRHGAYADPDIFANDVVVVGDNHARRLFKDYLTTFGTLAGPLVIVFDRVL